MRIVVKVGTSTLTHGHGGLNIRCVEELCKVLSDLKNAGHDVILVSSGAIGMGVGKLSLPARPADIPGKQATAAVGQCELMYIYDKMFGEYNQTVGQLLITNQVMKGGKSSENFTNTLFRLLEWNVIPIVNENDTMAVHEIEIGDNDTLSAIVARAAQADLLILLSDIDGLYTADPHKHPEAKRIPVVEEVTPEIEAMAGSAGSALGTGGMMTKLNAAKMVWEQGIDMIIAYGARPAILYDILEGKPIGTRFLGRKSK